MDIISISPAALAQIKNAAQEHTGMALRIAAKVAPDESFEYGMGFDNAKEDDAVFETEGMTVVISPDCIDLLNGAHLDFVEIEPNNYQFIFLNPNDPNYKPPTDEDALKDLS
jgi:iron-sulfur cluster assembly protein